jgi:hypothetical protein
MLHTLTSLSWAGPFSTAEQENAIVALESGQVVYFPRLQFQLTAAEKELLTPCVLEDGFKNVSFNPKNKRLKGAYGEQTASLATLMERFFKESHKLLVGLFPAYQKGLLTGRTSYRPAEIAGRTTSLLKNDTRLHVDAFPATPNQGQRILRVFTNINPVGEARVWHLGEPFEEVVKQFLPKLQGPWFGVRKILSLLKITKSYRSLYDHYMLMLHDEMKKNDVYQERVNKTVAEFPSGSTWVVMTDAVSHAALSGQFVLEQTCYLPVRHMKNLELSPLKILERRLERDLAK